MAVCGVPLEAEKRYASAERVGKLIEQFVLRLQVRTHENLRSSSSDLRLGEVDDGWGPVLRVPVHADNRWPAFKSAYDSELFVARADSPTVFFTTVR
jgi:hypothetical protein